MKYLQGATFAMLCALLVTSTALAQQPRSAAPRPVPQVAQDHYVIEGPVYHQDHHGHHGHHGGCCSRGGCYPEDSHCCDPCGPHGLNKLFARMKQKMCERKCRCCAKQCKTVCCTEPACGTVDHCCPQKTCCPHPTSCAPELGPCCDTRRCKKPFFLSRLFQDKCATGHCGPAYGAPVREGCCAPAIHRGDYPLPPVPVEEYEAVPRQPSAPSSPATEPTSAQRRYDAQKRPSTTAARSSRGPI